MEASASSQMQVTVLSCPCEAEIPQANGVSGGTSCGQRLLQMILRSTPPIFSKNGCSSFEHEKSV